MSTKLKWSKLFFGGGLKNHRSAAEKCESMGMSLPSGSKPGNSQAIENSEMGLAAKHGLFEVNKEPEILWSISEDYYSIWTRTPGRGGYSSAWVGYSPGQTYPEIEMNESYLPSDTLAVICVDN